MTTTDKYRPLLGRLLCVMRCHKKMIDVSLEPSGLHHSQHRLLHYLIDHPALSQAKLAEGLEVSPANVAVTLKKLEKDGYINKVTDSHDNRNNHIILTEQAIAILQQTKNCFDAVDRQMFSGFSEEELRQLSSYFDRMYENLTSQDRKDLMQ